MSTATVTNFLKYDIGQLFIREVSDPKQSFYIFFGNHLSMVAPNASINDFNSTYNVYDNMIFGKLITNNDVLPVITRIPYIKNQIYAMWDDKDIALFDKSYYVTTQETNYFHTWMCLYNANGGPSLVQPAFSQGGQVNTSIYETSDGYRWKYIYSVTSSIVSRFGTSQFFPIVPNTIVQNAAVPGKLQVINIEYGGIGYNNYITGTFSAQNIKYQGDSSLYEIQNENASSTPGFYSGCILYITTGISTGHYRRIIDYFIDSGRRIMRIETPFISNKSPIAGDQFEIYPEVSVIGGGINVSPITARAIVNSALANSITKVEVLDGGANFEKFSASVLAHPSVLVSNVAILRPIFPPIGGYASNPIRELNSSRLCVSIYISNSESNTIPVTNDYRQFGILRNAKFSNVEIHNANITGNFISGENIYKANPFLVAQGTTTNTLNTLIFNSNTDFTKQLSYGQRVLLVNDDQSIFQLANVKNIINSSSFLIQSNSYFNSSNASVFVANISTEAVISDLEATSFFISNVQNGTISSNDILIGEASGAQCIVNTILRNNVNKSFNTFNQLFKMQVIMNSGNFQQDEIIYQGNSTVQTANGALHSVINIAGPSVEIYASNTSGFFANTGIIHGTTSGAVATVTNIYSGELVYGSGSVIFYENIDPVMRAPEQTDLLKVFFSF